MTKRDTSTAKRLPTIEELRPLILAVTSRHGVTNVRVFGSFARGEQRATSDVDLLVDLPEHFSLLDHAGLKLELEDALGRKVDVVCDRSLKPALCPYVFADARPL